MFSHITGPERSAAPHRPHGRPAPHLLPVCRPPGYDWGM